HPVGCFNGHRSRGGSTRMVTELPGCCAEVQQTERAANPAPRMVERTWPSAQKLPQCLPEKFCHPGARCEFLMTRRFEDQVAWVTGATSGIGRATSIQFAREGARVGVLGRNQQSVQEAVNEVQQYGVDALPLEADVREPEAMQRTCQSMVEHWG